LIICQDAIAMSQNIWINLPVKDVEKVSLAALSVKSLRILKFF